MEAEILDDVITYLGDEVAEKDLSVLFILIQRAIRKVCAKRYPFGYTDTEKETAVERYRDTIFAAAVYYWAKQGLMVKALTARMESAEHMRKKTISILMLSRWQKFSEPYVIPKVDSPFKRRSVSGRYLPGWTQGVRCEWWWASAFFFCGGYGGKVNDDMKLVD